MEDRQLHKDVRPPGDRIGGNPSQTAAITHTTGPAVVLAGPGSGKTFVITQRIRFLIEQEKIPPDQILTITFTRAAALQMRRRFLKITDNRYPEAVFGTFHSVYYRIIQDSRSGKSEESPRIITDKEKTGLLKMVLTDLSAQYPALKPTPELLNNYLTEIGRLKCGGYGADRAREDLYEIGLFPAVFEGYARLLKETGALDFEDILINCRELLQSDTRCLAGWQLRFPYIQIDEYQDINRIQFETVRLLAGERKNLFVVGDDDQSIYGFRGSDPGFMLHFQDSFPEAKTYLLNTNYRCRPAILQAAGRVILVNKERYDKETHAGRTDEQGLVRTQTYTKIEEEAAAICDWLLQESGVKKDRNDCRPGNLNEHAVIVRTHVLADVFREACEARGIPVGASQGQPKPKERTAEEDILAYLRLSGPKKRQADLYRIMNRPRRFLSRECIRSDPFDFDEARRFYRGRASLADHLQKLERDLKLISSMRPALAIRYIRAQMGYDAFVRSGEAFRDPEAAIRQLDALQEKARSYSAHALFIKVMQEEAQRAVCEVTDTKKDGVQILTMHAAKGLEFDSVWLPELNEGVLPARRVVLPSEIEEERRLFYVAMTRARRALILSYLDGNETYGYVPSRFLRPILTQDAIRS